MSTNFHLHALGVVTCRQLSDTMDELPKGPPPATPMGPPVEQPAPHQSVAEGQDASAKAIDATQLYPEVWRIAELQPSAIHMKDLFGRNTAVLHSHLEVKPLVHRDDNGQDFCIRGAYQYWNGGKGKTAFAEVCAGGTTT